MTSNDSIERLAKCPVCGMNVDFTRLARVGLSHDELLSLADHATNKTLGDVLRIAEIAKRWLGDPEMTNMELLIKKLEKRIWDMSSEFDKKLMSFSQQISIKGTKDISALTSELTSMRSEYLKEIHDVSKSIVHAKDDTSKDLNDLKQCINSISSKIGATGIGVITEKTVIQDLKRAMANTMDSFSDERASRHGTDIVATVREKSSDCGRISLSVKNTEKWENKYMTQLNDNMRDDGNPLGILATRSFPAEALSEQMYVSPNTERGATVIVVKPEYVPLAYFALRHVAVHLFETSQMLKTKDAESDEVIKTSRILIGYINSSEFQQSIGHIDRAIKDAQEMRTALSQMRAYVNTGIDKSIKLQNSIEENLNHAKDLIEMLKRLISDHSSDTSVFGDSNE